MTNDVHRRLEVLRAQNAALKHQQEKVRAEREAVARRVREEKERKEFLRAENERKRRDHERYRLDPYKTAGMFDRYREADDEFRAWINAQIAELFPYQGREDDNRGHPSYAHMPIEGRLVTLGAFLGLNEARNVYPRLLLLESDHAAGRYLYEHQAGPADLAAWRERLPIIRTHLGEDYDWSVERVDSITIRLSRHTPLPEQIPFHIGLLRKGQVFFGFDMVRREPVYTSLADLTHTLVCGQNGEGKSTLLNTVLLSLLFNAELIDGLTLVDLKGGIELARYEGLLPGKLEFVDRIEQLPDLCAKLRAIMESRFARLRAERKVKAERGFHFVIIDEYAPIQLQKPSKRDPVDYAQMHDDLLMLANQGRAPGIKLWAQLQQPVDAMMSTAFRAQMRSIVCFKVPALNAGIVFDGATDFPVRPSDLPPFQCIVALRGEPKRLVKAPYIPNDLDLAAIVAARATTGGAS